MSLTDIAREYKALQDLAKEKADALKEVNDKWTECENRLLDALVDEGVNSIRIDGIGLLSMSTKNMLNVTAANKEVYFEYLKKTGNDGILKLDVNPRTNGAFLDTHLVELIKGWQEEGLDELDARKKALEFLNEKAGVSYFSKRGISLRKA